MQGSVVYNLVFAAIICVVCAIVVSSSAVTLRDRQEANQMLDMQRNVLVAAGLADSDESLSEEQIAERFAPIRQVVIDRRTGEASGSDPLGFDGRLAAADTDTSEEAPPNNAGLMRVADEALVYEVAGADGELDLVVLPVHGLGLWGILYGFVAIDADLEDDPRPHLLRAQGRRPASAARWTIRAGRHSGTGGRCSAPTASRQSQSSRGWPVRRRTTRTGWTAWRARP